MKNILPKMVLVFTGLLCALVLGEISVRTWKPQATIASFWGPYQFSCYEKGAYYFARLRPNKHCTLTSNLTAFPPITVKTNSMGFRNREIAKEKLTDLTRILFIGDSFTMGVGVSEQEAYPRLVESLMNNNLSKPKVETINAGINGVGPGSYYLLLKHEGATLAPDIVVVGFLPWNDISYDVESSEYVVDKDDEGFPDTIDSKTAYVDYTGTLRQKNLPLRFKIPYVSSSHLFGLIASRLSPLSEMSDVGVVSTFSYCLYDPACHQLDQAKETTKTLLKGMKKMTDRHGQKLLIVIIPTEFQIDDTSTRKYEYPPLLPSQKWAVSREFSQFFDQQGIDYLDLLPTFLEHPDKKTYFDRDPHWNQLGHTIAAQAIAQKLATYLP